MPGKNVRDAGQIEAPATTLLPSRARTDARRRGVGQPGRSGPPGNGNARTHGLHTMRKAIATLGGRLISRRTRVGRQLHAWRAALADDLGGFDALSTQQRALLDEAVKLKLMLDAVDAWVLTQPSLVNKAKRSLYPIVRERLALVGQLQSLLRDLGLERRPKDPLDLTAYLAGKAPTATTAAPAARDGAGREGT